MSILEPEVGNPSLLCRLKEAEDTSWSGIIKVLKDDEQVGIVVMYIGKLAWATSTKQIENFGSFLEKIGMIPKERQKEIFDQCLAVGKTRELGELFEKTGLISRETLRTCLEKQIQEALQSLTGIENVVIRNTDCEINANVDLLFHLSEVLPHKFEYCESENASAFKNTEEKDFANIDNDNGLATILKYLSSLTGYQYSFICDPDSNILASHKTDCYPYNLDEVIAFSIPFIISTTSSFLYSNIGKIEFVLLEHDKGSLVAQWSNLERSIFVVASFDKSGKTGVIRHKISELLPAIIHVAGEQHNLLEK